MKTKLFSPLLTAANNIVKTRRPLTKRAKEYDAFINWLDTSNKDVKKIKLPKVKKVEELEFSVGMSLGGDGGGSLNFVNILKKLGAGAAGGFGLRFLIKKFNKGKPAIKATKESRNIFSRISTIGQKTKPTGVKAANNIVNFNRQPQKIESSGPKVPKMGMGSILKGGATFGIGILLDQLVESGINALDAKIIADKIQYANTLPTQKRNQYINKLKGELKKENNWQSGFGGVFDKIIALGGETQSEKRSRTISAILSGTGNAPDKIDTRLKAQEKKQREAASASNVTFVSITNKFDKVVSKFEKIAGGMGAAPGKQPGKAGNDRYEPSDQPLAPNDPTEPPPPPLPPGSFAKAPDEVLTDASSFRQAFPLAKGTPKLSIEPYELQMRENDSLGSLGNDPQVDPVHAKGSAHYENRAIDIPVNNMDLGDKVANWWRGKGYKVLWRVEGHYNHVHVQWAKGQKKDKKAKKKEQPQSQTPPPAQAPTKTPVNPSKLNASSSKILDAALRGDTSVPGVYDPKNPLKRKGEKIKEVKPRSKAQIAPAQIPQISKAITNPLQQQASGPTILLGQSSVAPAGQSSIVPVPIPMGGGGGGGGVAVASGQILNSIWQLAHLIELG